MKTTKRYGLLFELSQDAITEIEMVDGVPIVRTVNPAFVDIFGYDREVILGESLNDFIVPDHHRTEAATFDRRTAEGEANWATVARKTADGIREFLYRGVPFERGGESHGLAIYTDITEQRRREQHHQVLHRVLRHNLRNDLSRILVSVEALQTETDDAFVAEYARRIQAAADDIQQLSTAASRVETILGTSSTEHTTTNLAATVRELTGRYNRSEGVTIETELPRSVPVTADERLWEALDALVENAVEHGSPDDDTSVVRVTLTTEGSEGVVSIADDGPGIPEYERAAVFDDRPPSQLSHGSGLGLWLAKWVIESYGGRLTYQRRGGETIVAARLPLATPGEQQRRN